MLRVLILLSAVISFAAIAQPVTSPDDETAPTAEPVDAPSGNDSGAIGAPVPLGPVPGLTDFSDDADGTGIDEQPLSGISVDDGFGVLDPRDARLRPRPWEGTDRALAEGLLSNLPEAISSTVQRDLLRRLLLVESPAPKTVTNPFDAPPGLRFTQEPSDLTDDQDDVTAGAEAETPVAFIDLRLTRLIRMGELEAAADLLMTLPMEALTEARLRRKVEIALLLNQGEVACLDVNALAADQRGAFWTAVRGYCQLLAGQTEQAQLTAQIALSEGGETGNLPILFEALIFGDVEIDRLPAATALDIALWRLTGQPAPEDLFAARRQGWQLALAHSPDLPPEQRLRAAWRPAQFGLIEPALLDEVFAGAEFEADARRRAMTLVEQDLEVGRRAFALLAQAHAAAETNSGRAEILALAINELDGRANSVRDWLITKVDTLPVTPELAWFGPSAAKLYYAAGKPTAARQWVELARRNTDPRLFDAIDKLWPMTVIAGHAGVTPSELRRWIDLALGDTPNAQTQGRVTRVLAVLDALGEPIPPESWDRIIAPEESFRITVPSTALLYRLQDAGRSGRHGEVITMAALVLGDDGSRLTHSSLIVQVIEALLSAELEIDARALAQEAVARAVW